nr:outer membrane protein transport protein [Nitrospirota bacterium]
MVRARLIAVWVSVILAWLGSEAFAGGLTFSEHGAKATGMANAFAGQADDPSALHYNPAGITQLPGTQVMIGTSVVYLDTTFRSSTTGESTQLQDQFPIIPHLFITHKFKTWDKLSIGLGITTPFGLVIDWPDNWSGRFDSINAKFRATIIQPTVAYQVMDNLSVAAGLRYANVAAEFQQKFNVGTGESKARVFDATANPIGWNVGLLYKLPARYATSVGLQFRSEIQAKLNGELEVSGPAAALFKPTKAYSSFKMPPQFVLGVSTKVIPNWTINADIEWEGWSTIGAIPLHFQSTSDSAVNQQALDTPGSKLWRNSYVYRLGAEYKPSGKPYALRAGYFFDETPIPDNTFDTNIPNANLHAFTVGSGYEWTIKRPWLETLGFDIAYLIGFYEKRSIDNSTLDPNNKGGSLGLGTTAFGSYASTAHVLTVSVTFKF